MCAKIFSLLPALLDPLRGEVPRPYREQRSHRVTFVRSDCGPCLNLLQKEADQSAPLTQAEKPLTIVFLESDRLAVSRKLRSVLGGQNLPKKWKVFLLDAETQERLREADIPTPLLCQSTT